MPRSSLSLTRNETAVKRLPVALDPGLLLTACGSGDSPAAAAHEAVSRSSSELGGHVLVRQAAVAQEPSVVPGLGQVDDCGRLRRSYESALLRP